MLLALTFSGSVLTLVLFLTWLEGIVERRLRNSDH